MKYQWILFDADETLFSFNSYLGLKAMLKRYHLDFTADDYAAFQAINKPLWVAYQNQAITAQDLQRIRFEKLAQQTGQDPLQLNQELMAEMAFVSEPLPEVRETVAALHGKLKMAIITNGFDALQQRRLEKTAMSDYFETVIVSEKVGVAKPDPQIFHAAFAQMGDFDPQAVLMVGDTLSSDILGGNQVGIATCWFNHANETNDTAIQPTYEIQRFSQLLAIASGQR